MSERASTRLKGIILLPHLRVQNANAISGPLSWGFPPPSSFLGFVHALQRKLSNEKIRFDGVGIISHRFDPQVTKTGYRYYFNLSKNPVDSSKKIEKDGHLQGVSFVEEGRAHLELSLLIGVHGYNGYIGKNEGKALAQRVLQTAQFMHLAGGSLLPSPANKRHEAKYLALGDNPDSQSEDFKEFRRSLLPGFALLHRKDLLLNQLTKLKEKRPEATAFDAMLDLVQLKIEPDKPDPEQTDKVEEQEQTDKVEWHTGHAQPGWLVPLPIGYGSISQLYQAGEVKNARADDLPFCFVESLYSLGEWRSPHRIDHPLELLWYYQAQPEAGLYICDHQPNEPKAQN